MDWLKRFGRATPTYQPPPPPPRIFDLWRQKDEELEDAKRRVKRLMAEIDASHYRRPTSS